MPQATRPGDVLGERYRLVDLLTESGPGRFWRAYDSVLSRDVAIHVISDDDPRAPGLMEAARLAATVVDRRVLRVLDIEPSAAGLCYVVNEWGWGTSLDLVASTTGAIGSRRSAWLVSEVAESVALAHSRGVAHGRLIPENVLIDRAGEVRLVGFCVDAALHGVHAPSPERDLTDLAGLLYCGLTGRWGGVSQSVVPEVPRRGGMVPRPRQIRAGIPRPLDSLCDELLYPGAHRHRELPGRVRTAKAVSEFLLDFVGDATDMRAGLLAAAPDVLPETEQVVLPQVPDLLPHDLAPEAAPKPPPAPEPIEPQPEPQPEVQPEPQPEVPDVPTEAGVPIFGEDDDVSWLERRATPPPPPPPFEAPPERPLFAAEQRRPRDGVDPAGHPQQAQPGQPGGPEYWPWETNVGRGPSNSGTIPPVTPAPLDDDEVPGRRWLRAASYVAVLALIAVATLVAFNLGRGDGDEPQSNESVDTSTSGGSPSVAAPAPGDPVTGLQITAFDPLGSDGTENNEDAALAVDGDPATAWGSENYNDQLGPPPGLKTGVGLVVDLGRSASLTQLDLTLVTGPAAVSFYLTPTAPTSDPSTTPGASALVEGEAATGRTTFPVSGTTTGQYLTLWFTALPPSSSGGFSVDVAEIAVRARPNA